MELFRSESTGELVFSSYMWFEDEFNAHVHEDDTREFYMDDNELLHGLFYEVEPDDFNIYKEWCHQQGIKPQNYSSLELYIKKINEYGDFY
jgi:hypothetical protein